MPRRFIQVALLDVLLGFYYKTEQNLGGYLVEARQEYPSLDPVVLEAIWYGFHTMAQAHEQSKTWVK